jgi:predicted metal-dependent enzyme (double-stranded beta helix superfamily)
MTHAVESGFDRLRARLDDAVMAGETADIVRRVKEALEGALRDGDLALPARFHVARSESYARRLLHRDPRGRYIAVVMTWGPGQKTALHDHAGIWCVECVVDGEMTVTQYDLGSERDGRYRFTRQSSVTAARGSAGCLIPPFEYHTLGNARPDAASITLHVYGGEMDHCHIFEPLPDGSYRKLTRSLSYND